MGSKMLLFGEHAKAPSATSQGALFAYGAGRADTVCSSLRASAPSR